jgi:hypothetical protein
MKTEPRKFVEELEAAASLPAGSNERFRGYGVMGLPFRSVHYSRCVGSRLLQ